MSALRKFLAEMTPEDRAALLECLLPSETPFFNPPDPTPDFSEWETNALGKNSEDAE